MITGGVRTKFEELNLKKNEVIKIKFSENKNGQFEVFDIERMILSKY